MAISARLKRPAANPSPAKPTSIIAHVEGSGSEDTPPGAGAPYRTGRPKKGVSQPAPKGLGHRRRQKEVGQPSFEGFRIVLERAAFGFTREPARRVSSPLVGEDQEGGRAVLRDKRAAAHSISPRSGRPPTRPAPQEGAGRPTPSIYRNAAAC